MVRAENDDIARLPRRYRHRICCQAFGLTVKKDKQIWNAAKINIAVWMPVYPRIGLWVFPYIAVNHIAQVHILRCGRRAR